MATIAENLSILSAHLEDAYAAGANKGATIPTEHRAANLSAMIDSIPTPVPDVLGEISFLDTDGHVLSSMTKEEALALTSLPPLPPTRADGLQHFGWNCASLEEFKKQAATGKAIVGVLASYALDHTEVDIKTTRGLNSPTSMSMYLLATSFDDEGTISVDWGDGTAIESFELGAGSSEVKLVEHQYQDVDEEYTIKIYTEPTKRFLFKSVAGPIISTAPTSSTVFTDRYKVKRVRLGSNCHMTLNLTASYAAFAGCSSMEEFDFGTNGHIVQEYMLYRCTSLKHVYGAAWVNGGSSTVDMYSFNWCNKLEYLCIPQNCVNGYLLQYCTSLKRVSIYIDGNCKNIKHYAFARGGCLEDIAIPYNCTTIGGSAFLQCAGNITTGVTNATFAGKEIIIPANCVLESATNTFQHTGVKSIKSLAADGSLRITADSLNLFRYCFRLEKCPMPVDSNGNLASSTSAYTFQYSNIKKVTFPADTTGTMQPNLFVYCWNLRVLDFSQVSAVIPLASSTAIPAYCPCVFVVPDSLYDEWIATTNWSTMSSRIIKSSEYVDRDYFPEDYE